MPDNVASNSNSSAAESEGSSDGQTSKSSKPAPPSIDDVAREYTRRVNALDSCLNVVMKPVQEAAETTGRAMVAALKRILKDDENGKQHLDFSEISETALTQTVRRASESLVAVDIVPKSFLMSLVSEYDAFLGALIQCMYFMKPEMLNASAKTFTLKDLVEFANLEEAKHFVIEKEVESILRNSHAEQFIWLEKQLGVTLKKGLDIWPTFIEITERRNLLAHNDGKVSRLYIENCLAHGVPGVDKLTVGTPLSVDSDYFSAAYECFMELGIKLAFVVWSKLASDEVKPNAMYHHMAFSLLVNEKFTIAARLLEFTVVARKPKVPERDKLIDLINLCIAYRRLGEDAKCAALLTSEDWSAKSAEFRMAHSILSDKFSHAAALMKEMGVGGHFKKQNYIDWPLFWAFRAAPEFTAAFQELFGIDFAAYEQASKLRSLQDLAKESPELAPTLKEIEGDTAGGDEQSTPLATVPSEGEPVTSQVPTCDPEQTPTPDTPHHMDG